MNTKHKVIFGNSMSMAELPDDSVHLIVTSPPYFNAPFDYKGLFKNFEQYLGEKYYFTTDKPKCLIIYFPKQKSTIL